MHKRVLLIEDDRAIQRLVERVFARKGYTLEIAVNGKEGIAQIETATYDAIVLDLMMPVVSGFEVLEWLDEHRPGTARGCVIVMTAASDRDVRKIDQGSVFAFVRKPFDIEDLVGTVARCVAAERPEPITLQHHLSIGADGFTCSCGEVEKIGSDGSENEKRAAAARHQLAVIIHADEPYVIATTCLACGAEMIADVHGDNRLEAYDAWIHKPCARCGTTPLDAVAARGAIG